MTKEEAMRFKIISAQDFINWLTTKRGARWLNSLPEPTAADCARRHDGGKAGATPKCRRRRGHRGLHTWENACVQFYSEIMEVNS